MGEEWEKLIGNAILGTTFFIPIITPSYFRSNPCRQELLKFIREADRLGLQKLLMPVYWVTVPELESDGADSTDEAIKAIATHQWQDLRDVRLEDRSSSEYRKAVSGLAAALSLRASEVTESVEDVPARSSEQTTEVVDEGPGYLERIVEGDDAIERLSPIMEMIGNDIVNSGSLAEKAGADIDAAKKRGQGTKAALTVTERLARELAKPASELEEHGHEYNETLVQLDSGMQARLELMAAQAEPLDSDQMSFLRTVQDLASTADTALDQLQDLVVGVNSTAKLSRSLRAPARRMRAGLQGVLDGRAIIADWGDQATSLLERDH